MDSFTVSSSGVSQPLAGFFWPEIHLKQMRLLGRANLLLVTFLMRFLRSASSTRFRHIAFRWKQKLSGKIRVGVKHVSIITQQNFVMKNSGGETGQGQVV